MQRNHALHLACEPLFGLVMQILEEKFAHSKVLSSTSKQKSLLLCNLRYQRKTLVTTIRHLTTVKSYDYVAHRALANNLNSNLLLKECVSRTCNDCIRCQVFFEKMSCETSKAPISTLSANFLI